jgi:7-cyano-7-deazaguanine reductase
MPLTPRKDLEVFDNPHPDTEYQVEMECPEFTSLCPLTGQPDFAVLRITYVPARKCVELKSLKAYLWSYRNEGGFYEDLTNRILKDLVTALEPHFLEIHADFTVRGGIKTSVTATHIKEGSDE